MLYLLSLNPECFFFLETVNSDRMRLTQSGVYDTIELKIIKALRRECWREEKLFRSHFIIMLL
jgi:hypothetical protein